MKWFVPLRTALERAEILRRNLAYIRDPQLKARASWRADVLEHEGREAEATMLARPLLDRAPALAKWADQVQNDRNRPRLERAAAFEFEALAWEEAGELARAQLARRNAAIALGAALDVAGFHLEPDVRW